MLFLCSGCDAPNDQAPCTGEVIEPPSTSLSDPCRTGQVVLGPERIHRNAGPPTDVAFTFDVTGGATCLTVVSDSEAGRHRVSSATVWVDGELVIEPGQFSQSRTTIEARLELAARTHDVRLRVASVPGTHVDLTVATGGDTHRWGLVQSDRLELWNLFAAPSVFSPVLGQTHLTAHGMVRSFAGLPSGGFTYVVRWAFEIGDPVTCEVVRSIEGETALLAPSTFSPAATWDGTDDFGATTDDALGYRLVAVLIRCGPNGESEADRLATAFQPLVADAMPPQIGIYSPEKGSFLTPDEGFVALEATLADDLSGVDGATVKVLVDGVERTAEVTTDAASVSGVLAVEDGDHVIRVEAADLAGNTTSAEVSSTLRTAARTIEELVAVNGEGGPGKLGLILKRHDNGTLSSLGGFDVAPGCTYSGALDRAAGEALAACFLRANAALLSGGEEAQDIARIRVTQVSDTGDGSGVVKMRQLVGPVPLEHSELSLGIFGYAIIAAGGEFVPSQDLPDFDPSLIADDTDQARQRAESLTGESLIEYRRYFSRERMAGMSEYRVLPAQAMVVRYDERREEVSSTYFGAASDSVEKTVPHVTYDRVSSWPYNFEPAGPDSVSVGKVWFRSDGSCNDNGMGADLDNFAWLLDGGAEFGAAHSHFNVQCYDENGASFPTGYGSDVGIPQTTVLNSHSFRAANAAFWLEDLATFANTPGVGYDYDVSWAPFKPRRLEIELARFYYVDGPIAVPTQSGGTDTTVIHLPEDPDASALPFGGYATSLRTIAHEYGHHIAYSYGYGALFHEGYNITEGWALHNEARYLMYRFKNAADRSHDAGVGPASYDTAWGDRADRGKEARGMEHEASWLMGENVPAGRDGNVRGSINDDFTDYFIYDNQPQCKQPDGEEANAYDCGSVIAQVYWELVWNSARAPFGALGVGQDIVTGTGPNCGGNGLASNFWEVVNRNYTRALATMPTNLGPHNDQIDTFFDFFTTYLNADNSFAAHQPPYDTCYLTDTDRRNVNSILAHHCVGPWAHYCSELYVRLPDRRYAVEMSEHTTFNTPNHRTDELVVGSQMDVHGTAYEVHPSSQPDSGNGVLLVSPQSSLSFDVRPHHNQPHTMRVVAKVLGETSPPRRLSVSANPGGPAGELYVGTSSYHLTATSVTLPIGAAATTITIESATEGMTVVAAALLECLPRECQPTECGSGLFDGCGGTIACAPSCLPHQCGFVPTACGGYLDCGPCGTPSTAAGHGHSCAVKDLLGGATEVRCWGHNHHEQLGSPPTLPTQTQQSSPVTVEQHPTGALVDAVGVVAGGAHSCALIRDGTVRCWGSNANGVLGIGPPAPGTAPIVDADTAMQVVDGNGGILHGVTRLAAGEAHNCAVLENGEAWCWGYNGDGRLGDGTATDSDVPVRVLGVGGITGISISAAAGGFFGVGHSCVVEEGRRVWCWGSNYYQQLGDCDVGEGSLVPVQVDGVSQAVAVSAGGGHTCARRSDGSVWCWGNDEAGQLGQNGGGPHSCAPVEVTGLPSVVAITTGGLHTCATGENGDVHCWGSNQFGQLGHRDADDESIQRRTPEQVLLPASASWVSAGLFHTCAAVGLGVQCWGWNQWGQLGDGTIGDSDFPVAVVSF